jgi:two-component sensor histidine kinase/ActR/RegA family two-component response regulator
VDHRARNALAVVQAIVRLTRGTSPQAYVQAVEGRIHALAQAHTLLSEARWQGADVARLVGEELAPYRNNDSRRVHIEGPSVFLSPEKAQNVALALHELATNSVKYGALSSVTGRLKVKWESKRGAVTLSWQEFGGPPVRPPATQGFGTKIMNASIKHQIGGSVALNWHQSGLHCTLQIPNDAGGAIQRTGDRKDENLVQLAAGTKKRVLLVEDEAIVGMMMRDILLEHGLFVIGPCCSLREAMSSAATAEFDCAILDLNLGGEAVYPVAAMLSERGIPFAFVTGYGRESIEDRYKSIPILQKPIVREGLEEYLRQMLGAEAVAAANPASPIGERDQSPSATA